MGKHKKKNKVDYSNMYDKRFYVLKKAFERFKGTDMSEFNRFLDENENWISNYGLFMSVKSANGGKPWFEWENGLKTRDSHSLWLWKSAHEDEVMFWEFLQFKFFGQWHKLKEYVNSLGIKIIGPGQLVQSLLIQTEKPDAALLRQLRDAL